MKVSPKARLEHALLMVKEIEGMLDDGGGLDALLEADRHNADRHGLEHKFELIGETVRHTPPAIRHDVIAPPLAELLLRDRNVVKHDYIDVSPKLLGNLVACLPQIKEPFESAWDRWDELEAKLPARVRKWPDEPNPGAPSRKRRGNTR